MVSKNHITIYTGKTEPQIYDLDSFGTEYVRLGRGPYHGSTADTENDIIIAPEISVVSRAQCTFHKTADGWHIHDDHSSNGLLFNGAKTVSQRLHDGDKFYIGKDVATRCVIAFSSQRGSSEKHMERFALTGKKKFVLGRDSRCDIVLPHPSVSRCHCIISCENGSYFINDNNSMNGISLNGALLRGKQKLARMDKITIADTSMVFCDHFLYFEENTGGVSIAACDLMKEVKSGKKNKCLLDHVNLSIEPGEFVAIIGGSGAGKTTLLNCLSGMADFTGGDVQINGESIRTNFRSMRGIIGYVPQNDIVYDDLTLERMLFYSAQLRMPKDTSPAEIRQKIDETLQMVELDAHRNTMISKLSGGQKKRASIAVELLASPKLFFLDEPSSGLDPGTEKKLMRMLKKLTLTGKTVIMVTHTVQNISMCDKLICMGNEGRLCYYGTPENTLTYFGQEHMTDIYEDLYENSAAFSERLNKTAANDAPCSGSELPEMKRRSACSGNGMRQFLVMTARYAELTINRRRRLILLMLMPILLTVLVCIAFQADGNLYNYLSLSVNRISFPFLVGGDTMRLMFSFACAGFWIGIFNSIQEISKERAIYEREQFTGIRPLPYIGSKFIVGSLLCVIQAAVMVFLLIHFTDTAATVDGNMSSVTALELNMQPGGIIFTNGGMWMELYITTLMTLLCAMCLGLAISSAVSNDMALVICPLCLLPQILFSGVACTLSGFTDTLSKIVPCRWTCIAYLTSAAVNDMYEACKYDMGAWTKTAFENGFGIDEAYSASKTYLFGLNPVLSAWAVLLILSVVCLSLSIGLLYRKKAKK